MKFYWSYTQFPELSAYRPDQKKTIWAALYLWDSKAGRKWEQLALATIVTFSLIGCIFGAFNAKNPDTGCLLGGIAGAAASAPFVYFLDLNRRRKLLQRYLEQDFLSIPLPAEAQALIDAARNNLDWPSPAAPQPMFVADPSYETIMNLRTSAATQPVRGFVNLVLSQAIFDHADKIEFSLLDAASKTGFRIRYSMNENKHECAPAHGFLFSPVVVVLCNYASIPYYTNGPARGTIRTSRPDSCWLLESDNLKKHVILSRPPPLPENPPSS